MFSRRSAPELPPGIRRADRRDVPRLVDLWVELMATHERIDPRFAVTDDAPQQMHRRFHSLVQDRYVLVLVAEVESVVIGFTVGHIDVNLPFFRGSQVGFISDLFVLEECRRQGHGRRLVEALKEWFRSHQVSSIQLHAAACNPEAYEFWKQMGFRDYLVRMWSEV